MLISEQQLCEIFGVKRFAPLKKKLEAQGVKFLHGTGGKVVTTLQSINRVLIGETENQEIEFYGQKK